MQTIHCSKVRSFLAAAAVLISSLGFATPVFANTNWGILNPDGKLTYPGTLGGSSSIAFGINDTGQVVGVSYTAAGDQHAFLTGPNGVGMTDLGTLAGAGSVALGINDAGQVVGYIHRTDDLDHAFITGPNGAGMTDLGTMGGYYSDAIGINDAGQPELLIRPMVLPTPSSRAQMA